MDTQEITRALATWGATTGTIGTISGLLGLFLRFRQHGLDKAKLKAEATFKIDGPNSSEVAHKIVVRSVGRRAVTLDVTRFYFRPGTFWKRLFRKWYHWHGQWVYDVEVRSSTKLAEGEKTEYKIQVPHGVGITDVCRVEIVDQSGKRWPVKWPSHKTLMKIATTEELDSFDATSESRVCSVSGFRLGDKFFLQTNFNGIRPWTGKISGRGFWFRDLESYKEKFSEVTIIQVPRFLAAEVDELV